MKLVYMQHPFSTDPSSTIPLSADSQKQLMVALHKAEKLQTSDEEPLTSLILDSDENLRGLGNYHEKALLSLHRAMKVSMERQDLFNPNHKELLLDLHVRLKQGYYLVSFDD